MCKGVKFYVDGTLVTKASEKKFNDTIDIIDRTLKACGKSYVLRIPDGEDVFELFFEPDEE